MLPNCYRRTGDEIAAGLETEESARGEPTPTWYCWGTGWTDSGNKQEEIEEQRIIETEVLETDDPQGHESDIDAQKEQKIQDEGQKGRGPKGWQQQPP